MSFISIKQLSKLLKKSSWNLINLIDLIKASWSATCSPPPHGFEEFFAKVSKDRLVVSNCVQL
jgi:hypothetical protein